MIDYYKMPEDKRLKTMANFHAWTVGALVNSMVKKFGQPALELLTEVFSQATITNIHKAKARGETFSNIDDFLRFYLSYLYISGMPTEIAEKTPTKVRIQVCKGLPQCPVFVEDPKACLAMFNGMEKVMLRNLLPSWDAEYARMLQKGEGACEILFSQKTGASSA